MAEPNTFRAQTLALALPRRPDWSRVQLAVMASLLRATYAQHPDLAQVLLSTGDGRIQYDLGRAPYWGTGREGRDWLGRLLELVRSELALEA